MQSRIQKKPSPIPIFANVRNLYGLTQGSMKINSAHDSAAFDAFSQMEEERATVLHQYRNTNVLNTSDDDWDSQHSVYYSFYVSIDSGGILKLTNLRRWNYIVCMICWNQLLRHYCIGVEVADVHSLCDVFFMVLIV